MPTRWSICGDMLTCGRIVLKRSSQWSLMRFRVKGTELLPLLYPMVARGSAQRTAEKWSILLVLHHRLSRPRRKSISWTLSVSLLRPRRRCSHTNLTTTKMTTTTMMMASQAHHRRSRSLHQSAPQERLPTTAPQAHPRLHAKHHPDARLQGHRPDSVLPLCPQHHQPLARPGQLPKARLLKHRARHLSRPLEPRHQRHLLLAGVRESRSQSIKRSKHPRHRR